MDKAQEAKRRHQEEVNNFEGIFWAFGKSQFKEGMEKIGLTEKDTDKIYSIGAGGYIRKDRSQAFDDMFKRHHAELKAIRQTEKTIKIKFAGIDWHNHAIFESIDKPKRYYGSTCTLFDSDATEADVLEKLNEDAICFFGSSFGCEPMGTDAGNLLIVR